MEAFARAIESIRRFGYPISAATAPLTDFSKGIANIEADREAIARRSFDSIDVLLLPTTATTTLAVTEAGKPLSLSPEYTMFANYYGLPAVSVPCGYDKLGVPLGLQIVAKPGNDSAVLQLAHRFQTETLPQQRRPPE